MRHKDVEAAPVVKEDKMLGITTERDFFKMII
jgi:CBS domain-containing protein